MMRQNRKMVRRQRAAAARGRWCICPYSDECDEHPSWVYKDRRPRAPWEALAALFGRSTR